ncbi:hypothetical protein AKJ16_DCAP13418 [Drosera capensis]
MAVPDTRKALLCIGAGRIIGTFPVARCTLYTPFLVLYLQPQKLEVATKDLFLPCQEQVASTDNFFNMPGHGSTPKLMLDTAAVQFGWPTQSYNEHRLSVFGVTWREARTLCRVQIVGFFGNDLRNTENLIRDGVIVLNVREATTMTQTQDLTWKTLPSWRVKNHGAHTGKMHYASKQAQHRSAQKQNDKMMISKGINSFMEK